MPIYSLNHARSGSDRLTASTFPLIFRPHCSQPTLSYSDPFSWGFAGRKALKDRLINRRLKLPRLLLALSSEKGQTNGNDKNNPTGSQGLTGHSISEGFRCLSPILLKFKA
jgi:hypothetical protein